MTRPPAILLAALLPFAAACSPSAEPSDASGDADAAGDDEEEGDVSADPAYDGPGCPEDDRDEDTIPDDVEGEGDTDGDTVPDYLDEDSDGDTILDRHEAGDFDCGTKPVDTDGNGTPDYLDLDSDGDTLPDAEEAGDDDLRSYPRDTDEWGTPDFQDVDSDNDGLSDRQETELGLEPHDEDSDGDGHADFEEIASASGDPLDETKTPGEEDIFILWYKGRSQYRTYTAAVHYNKNDVFLLVDDTESARGAAGDIEEHFGGRYRPLLDMSLDGLETGLGVFSGWGMSTTRETMPFTCYHHFFGLMTMTDSKEEMEEAVSQIPSCGEPRDGSSAVAAIYNAVEKGTGNHWPPELGECPGEDDIGGACFRTDARRFVFLIEEGDFPQETPPGYLESRTMDEVKALLAERGVHLVGIMAQDELYEPPYHKVSDLARASGAVDRTMRPLVYLAGSDGSDLETALENALDDIMRSLPADVGLLKVDGPDWPEGADIDGDGEPDEYDATGLVSTIYPEGWSPPPGVSPSEAVRRIDEGTYVGTVPDTEISYKIYFRNYSFEQRDIGHCFEVRLVLANQLGYVFTTWPVKLIIPCLAGDESVTQD